MLVRTAALAAALAFAAGTAVQAAEIRVLQSGAITNGACFVLSYPIQFRRVSRGHNEQRHRRLSR